jgi:CheY-like chemotaxis protein
MPDIDGLELLRTLHEMGFGFPVVMITAYSTPAADAAAERSELAALLAKPVDPAILLGVLADILA